MDKNDNLIKIKDQLMDINDKLAEIKDQLMDKNDRLIEVREQPVFVTDIEAKRWYDFGFLFGLNYVYAKLSAANPGTELTKGEFKDFVNRRFSLPGGGLVVDDDFFTRYPFRRDGPIDYGPNGCPGDLPNTCIPCTARGIEPFS